MKQTYNSQSPEEDLSGLCFVLTKGFYDINDMELFLSLPAQLSGGGVPTTECNQGGALVEAMEEGEGEWEGRSTNRGGN